MSLFSKHRSVCFVSFDGAEDSSCRRLLDQVSGLWSLDSVVQPCSVWPVKGYYPVLYKISCLKYSPSVLREIWLSAMTPGQCFRDVSACCSWCPLSSDGHISKCIPFLAYSLTTLKIHGADLPLILRGHPSSPSVNDCAFTEVVNQRNLVLLVMSDCYCLMRKWKQINGKEYLWNLN